MGMVQPLARGLSSSSNHQAALNFSALRNSELFSAHWLELRLPLEPEWRELSEDAARALDEVYSIWARERANLPLYQSEAALENSFIQPILRALGWSYIHQPTLNGRRPDYALFTDDEARSAALQSGQHEDAFWSHAAVVADAKAWGVSLDRPTAGGGQKEYPPQQIEWYLDRSRKEYGLLTNGALWRVSPRVRTTSQPRFKTFLEVNFAQLMQDCISARQAEPLFRKDVELFLPFFLLFGPDGYRPGPRNSLVLRAAHGSSEYALAVSDDLSERVYEALRLAIEGFSAQVESSSEETLAYIKEQSFIFLFRLLFTMFAEDRGLLPLRTNRVYRENRSLSALRDLVAHGLDAHAGLVERAFSPERFGLWDSCLALFDMIDVGHAPYGVQAYNGGLFAEDRHPFLRDKRLNDLHMAQVIDYLSRTVADPRVGLVRVDYRDLQIQQLGNIYESLLELHPVYANTDVSAYRTAANSSELLFQLGEEIPDGLRLLGHRYSAGSVYLRTDKGERRQHGTYYTPDHVVQHLVVEALSPVFDRVSRECAADEGVAALGWSDRILKIRVLDPAMGSGHFLLRAVQYLAEELSTNPLAAEVASDEYAEEEGILNYWKRRVVERCVYGVDLNPLAVELGKLALWLDTVARDKPLSFLDHHLRCGNSLVSAELQRLAVLPDAPPVVERALGAEIETLLRAISADYRTIEAAPSDTVRSVKRKERLLYETIEPNRSALKGLADVWVSSFWSPRITAENYKGLVEALILGNFAVALEEDHGLIQEIRSISETLRPFHWEIEFPEVRSEGGFSVIVGNPPYKVLVESVDGPLASGLGRYVQQEARFAPSRVGKNNTYKLFMCLCMQLLRPYGRMALIVPMTLLGDEGTAGIRDLFFRYGQFERIDVFPQKDRPADRIFKDAKLATTALVYEKRDTSGAPFAVWSHPGRYFTATAATMMNAEQVRLLDPLGAGIPIGDSEDLRIAAAVVSRPQSVRLGVLAEFFQGEVNETNARKAKHLATSSTGKLVTRGASVTLYAVREASQGADLYLNVEAFLKDKDIDSKAFHHRHERIVLQESSPQNNFRRIIAARLPPGEFCNHTINYCPSPRSRIPLSLLLAFLNSKLHDWFFRVISTNAHVSQYQLALLPVPRILSPTEGEQAKFELVSQHLLRGELEEALAICREGTSVEGTHAYVASALCLAVEALERIECERVLETRASRSSLAPPAERIQGFIDEVVFSAVGMTREEAAHVRLRLETML